MTKDILQQHGIQDYELYMVRNRVFSSYYPVLHAHLPRYIRFEESLHDVSKVIIEEIRESRK